MITTLEQVKLILGITGDSKNALITALIPLIEEDYLAIRNKAFDLDDEGEIVYPTGAEFTAIRMIGYKLNTQGQDGVASESLSRHSISYQQGSGTGVAGLYPASVIGAIKRYAEFV
jgi:hypothetical protein